MIYPDPTDTFDPVHPEGRTALRAWMNEERNDLYDGLDGDLEVSSHLLERALDYIDQLEEKANG